MALSLVKEKADKVGLSLKKKGVAKVPPMRVTSLFDVSGSMSQVIARGHLQKAADQVLGVAYKFDDNGEVDVFAFDDNVRQAPVMTINDFGSYIADKLVGKGFATMGSTRYDRALQAVIDFLFAPKGGSKGFLGFGAKKGSVDDSLALVLFFTDGAPDSGDRAAEVLKAAKGKKVYFQMIGVGGSSFPVLADLANRFDNVGYVQLSSFNMSDEEVYGQLVSDEFVRFLKDHGAA